MTKGELIAWLGDPATKEDLLRLAHWCQSDQWARNGCVPSQATLHGWVLAKVAEEVRGCEDPCAEEWANKILRTVLRPPLSLGDLQVVIRLETQIAGSLALARALVVLPTTGS
jgi:hypothetical protein